MAKSPSNGVDHLLSGEQRDLREAVAAFGKTERLRLHDLNRPADAHERLHDPDVYRKLAELGWIGVAVPEEFGGGGGSIVDLSIVLEETARALLPLEGFQVSMIVNAIMSHYGNADQCAAVLGGISDGRVMAIAMSEPDAGSDLSRIACRARRGSEGYLITGQKTWTSAAHMADSILLVARTGDNSPDASPYSGLSMLLVPHDAAGLTISPISTMGGHEVNDLYFTDVHVPESALVGREGKAWGQLVAGLNQERLIVAAQALGMAAGALDQVVDYVGKREQFGRPVGSFQAVSHRIADLAMEIESTRSLVYSVALAVVETPDMDLARLAAMAKLKATELAKKTTLEGMQLMGGLGYTTEGGMEEQVRRALKMTIGGGTSEIQREMIARTLGLGRGA